MTDMTAQPARPAANEPSAAEFTRPLLLTPAEDMRGYLLGYMGRGLTLLITFVSVMAVFLIFLFVIRETVPFLWVDSLTASVHRVVQFLTSGHWYPQADTPEFGARALIVGSFYVTAVALLLAVPVGLMSAVFLSDIAPFNLRQIIKPVIELLAAIPSVAYGFFAIIVVAPWLQRTFGFPTGANILNVVHLRQQVGMVFQKPNPFAKSIYDNVAYGPRLQGVRKRSDLDAWVEQCLKDAALWDEVKDDLHKSALALSGGQQQRLCIARTLATKPRVVLMDEPCSALDPVATAKIEDLIGELKQTYTIVIVTHNMQQAARVSERTAFFCLGELIEYDTTDRMFTNPTNKETEDYITGRFG